MNYTQKQCYDISLKLLISITALLALPSMATADPCLPASSTPSDIEQKVAQLSAPITPSIKHISSNGLFQHRLYGFDPSEQLDCGDASSDVIPTQKLEMMIRDYELKDPHLSELAFQYLTEHTNSDHIKMVERFKVACASARNIGHCVLEKYWGSSEIATRVLALFYDTGLRVQRNNAASFDAVSLEELNQVEKAIRKLPEPLLQKMNHMANLGAAGGISPAPVDVDGQLTLTFGITGRKGKGDMCAVVTGYNGIYCDGKGLDSAASGSAYSDLGLQFNADFRTQMIVHEMGHVVDSFLFDNPNNVAFYARHIVSHDPIAKPLIENSTQAPWPNHWWDAFEGYPGIMNGRYRTNNAEIFAEMFAQYIMLPQALKQSAPEMYDWLKNKVFDGIEYQGYEKCQNLVKSISGFKKMMAPRLSPN